MISVLGFDFKRWSMKTLIMTEQLNVLLLNLVKERLRDKERKKERKKERRSEMWQSQVEEDKLRREGA